MCYLSSDQSLLFICRVDNHQRYLKFVSLKNKLCYTVLYHLQLDNKSDRY